MGHPSGSTRVRAAKGADPCVEMSRPRKRMPRLGRARRKTRPSLRGHSVGCLQIPRHPGRRLPGGCLLQVRQLGQQAGKLVTPSVGWKCPGLAAPRRKRAAKPSGDIRWVESRSFLRGMRLSVSVRPSEQLSSVVAWRTSPAWVGQAENPPKPCGTFIRPRQESSLCRWARNSSAQRPNSSAFTPSNAGC